MDETAKEPTPPAKTVVKIDPWEEVANIVKVIDEQLESKRGVEKHNPYAWEKKNNWTSLKQRLARKEEAARLELKKISPSGQIDTSAVNEVKTIHEKDIK